MKNTKLRGNKQFLMQKKSSKYILLWSIYPFPLIMLLIHFYQMVEDSGKQVTFAAVLVFNSAHKRLLGGLCVIKKSERIFINSVLTPFTHLKHSVLSCPFLLCCSAETMCFLWLLNLKSVMSWGSNSAL